MDKVLSNYYKGYNDTINVDTSFDYNGKKLRIYFMHYCTNDSAIQVPGKYVQVYGLKELRTHNFKSILKISSENNLVIDTVITKNLFRDEMFQEEKLYGVLLHPKLSFSETSMNIEYSISIPLTDVGVGVYLVCAYDGKLVVKKTL